MIHFDLRPLQDKAWIPVREAASRWGCRTSQAHSRSNETSPNLAQTLRIVIRMQALRAMLAADRQLGRGVGGGGRGGAYLDALVDPVHQPAEQATVEIFGKCVAGVVSLKEADHRKYDSVSTPHTATAG